MDKIERLAQFGNAGIWALKANDSPNDPLFAAKSVRREAITLISAFDDRAGEINDSREYTKEGKAKRLTEIGKTHLENLAALRLRLDPVTKAKDGAIAKARAKDKTPEEKIADLLMQTEIRRLLSEQISGDPNQLKISYFDALAAGDFATADAIEQAPMLWPGRPDADTLKQWQSERLAVETPELSEEVKDLTDALGETGAVLDSIEASIRDVTKVRPDDGISVVADADAT